MFSRGAKDQNQAAADSDTLSDSSSINLDSENEDAFQMPKIRTADIDTAGDRSFRSMVSISVWEYMIFYIDNVAAQSDRLWCEFLLPSTPYKRRQTLPSYPKASIYIY